jgi:hypothetical protein
MQGQAERAQLIHSDPLADERRLLLDEVQFKWLLAGMGYWIDMSRFHSDLSYASRFMELATASDSSALRDCAASLQTQIGGH